MDRKVWRAVLSGRLSFSKMDQQRQGGVVRRIFNVINTLITYKIAFCKPFSHVQNMVSADLPYFFCSQPRFVANQWYHRCVRARVCVGDGGRS